ncbi:MAG: transcriptional regulator [Gammaproteobacteria bacterium RBG_16_66_13]|nr:MAG: transcriptional regulator [Gammaproteobacteria bacterium RBG_16_66_13]
MPNERGQESLDYIAANLHRARTRAGMTQEQLAEAADLDLRFLQRIERGKTNLSVLTLTALANALAVPPGSLLKKATLPEVRRGRPPARKTRTR